MLSRRFKGWEPSCPLRMISLRLTLMVPLEVIRVLLGLGVLVGIVWGLWSSSFQFIKGCSLIILWRDLQFCMPWSVHMSWGSVRLFVNHICRLLLIC